MDEIHKMKLIPRVRMNYTFGDFIRSLFVSDLSTVYREKCEELLSDYYGGRPVILVSAGRCALYYILRTLKQSKVYIPAYTCSVVAEAVQLSGKEIRYVPTSAEGFNADSFHGIDSDSIVVATHQFGYPCAIKSIAQACKEVGAVLIEDCAAAIGTTIDGQLAGTFGDFAFVSFNHSKQLTIPRGGGCIVSRTSEQMAKINEYLNVSYDMARSIKNRRFALICLLINNSWIYRIFHSKMIVPYEHNLEETCVEVTRELSPLYHARIDDWQAYLLYVQLKRNDVYRKRRLEVFRAYHAGVSNPIIKKPKLIKGADYSRYAIRVDAKARTAIYQTCLSNGVDLDFSHSHLICPTSFAKEHEIAGSIVNLPFYYKITDHEVKKIIAVMNSLGREKNAS